MSYQIKASLVSLFSTIAGCTVFLLRVLSMQREGTLKLTERLQDWGPVLLSLIGVLIVMQIITYIIFAIINKIVTDEEPVDRMDELDKLVDLKVMRIAYWVFLAGFIGGLILITAGEPVWKLFLTSAIGMTGGGIVAEIAKICLYRRGG